MATDQEVTQRQSIEPTNPLLSDSAKSSPTQSITRQKSFKMQSIISKYQDRRADERIKEDIRDHVFLPPRWDNSFRMENAILGVFNIFAQILYAVMWYTGKMESATAKIIFGVLIFGLYILDCQDNGIMASFENILSFSEFEKFVKEMRQAKIQIVQKAQSFHHERNRQIGRKTNNNTKKVITYTEEIVLPISQITDSTADSTIFFEKAPYFRVHNFVSYSYADEENAKQFEGLKAYYKLKAKLADTDSESSDQTNCPGLQECLFVYKDGTKIDPLFSKRIYYIYCMVGLSLLYRIFLNRRVSFLEHCIHKEITYDPSNEPIEYTQSKQNQHSIHAQSQIIQDQQKLIEMNAQLLKQQKGIAPQNCDKVHPNPQSE